MLAVLMDAPDPHAGSRQDAPQPGNTAIRRAVLETCLELEPSGKFVDDVLAGKLPGFPRRDRHLIQEMTYGILRHRNTLDRLLDFHLKRPTRWQKPPVCWALRMGTYQLVYLSRVPAHAAVNQTLEALKSVGTVGESEVGFANAVLHKVAVEIRDKTEEGPVDPDDPTVLPVRRGYCHFNRPILPLRRLDPVAHLEVKHSHPSWIVARCIQRYGEEEAQELLRANNVAPRVTARITSRAPSRDDLLARLDAEGWKARPGHLGNSIILEQMEDPATSGAFAEGWFQIQDETAIQIGEALAPPEGATALDLCSDPGGKALQLLERIGPAGHLVAADRSPERLTRVKQNLSRVGSNFTASAVPEDPARIDLGRTFSHILVDAPCSNTGVLARRPEARWRIREQDLERLAEIQLGLLEAALRHLAPGGRLLYSTCSVEPEENENVVAKLVNRHGELVEQETRLFLPHRVPGDGGFYSLVLKPR
jgi:16S rRNA (cytosine967-C5)-methyltransferase